MNLQPYKVIVVRDPPVKQSLSLCMSKNNEGAELGSLFDCVLRYGFVFSLRLRGRQQQVR